MTPGQYLEGCRVAAGMTLEQLALCIDTVPPIAARDRAQLLGDIESGLIPVVSLSTAVALAAVPMLGVDLARLAELVDGDEPRLTAQGAIMVLVGRG